MDEHNGVNMRKQNCFAKLCSNLSHSMSAFLVYNKGKMNASGC
jgi:hypothetical protein